jgi:hypothetical protein
MCFVDIQRDPDGSLSCNLYLPSIQTVFMKIAGYKERLVDKLDNKVHRSNSRRYYSLAMW